MKYSVVVPFYNSEGYIDNCAESLVNQNFPKSEFEILFVDNNSNDKSGEILCKYEKCKKIKFVDE